MSFLKRGAPQEPDEPLFYPETHVDASVRRTRRIPAILLAIPMVLAFVWALWNEGSMVSRAVSGPRLAEGRYELIVLHMFAHGSVVHIAFNLLALATLGPAVMERLGPLRWRSLAAFMALFFGSGIGGVAVWLALNPSGTVPMLGASGAIFGLLGYLMRQPDPHGKPVPLLSPLLGRALVQWFRLHLPLVAIFAIPLLLGSGSFGLAWEAHLGGFLAGMVLCWPVWAWSGGRPDWVPDLGVHP